MVKASLSLRRFLACFGAFVFATGAALGQGPSAKASLSNETIAVGESTELRIEVQGASSLRYSGSPEVDGLSISGPQTSMPGFGNLGNFQPGITFVYNIEAERPGTFTIPAMRFVADGRAVETKPVALKVE